MDFNEIMWLGKSVMSSALTSPKKQLESLSVSSLIRKKQSTHNFLYVTSKLRTLINKRFLFTYYPSNKRKTNTATPGDTIDNPD
ncbi:hypothetical protein YC2023_036448 [Brassica napus]